jgi:hypothetical protein
MKHPLWMPAKDWLESRYFKEYSEGGKYCALFRPDRQVNLNTRFPIYPVLEIMLRLPGDRWYQPYWCCESKTYWVYCRVSDHSHDLDLKSAAELRAGQLAQSTYSPYHWTEEQRKKARVDLKIKNIDGEVYSRPRLTAEELRRLCKTPEDADKHRELVRYDFIKSIPWIQEVPHIEMPIKIYVAGCDDSSYTEILQTLGEALKKIEKFKKNPPASPWDNAVFTN